MATLERIQQIAAAAPTTSNDWVTDREAILTFATRRAADAAATALRAAGATVRVRPSAYGEYILQAFYTTE